MKRVLLSICLLAGIGIAGCASFPERSAVAPKYTPMDKRRVVIGQHAAQPELRATGATEKVTANTATWTIEPAEKITITMMGPPDQSQPFQTVVDEFGKVNLPYVKDVPIAGKTKSEAEKLIEKAYVDGAIYKSVTVVILPPEEPYFVRGEVNKPGSYALARDLTVLQAVAIAGGYTEFANPTEVKVLRNTQKFTLNLKKIENGAAKDMVVKPRDVIIVPKSLY